MSIKANLRGAAFTALHLIEKATGKQALNIDVWQAIAAQWVQEKGSSWWSNPQPNFNVGNVSNGGSQNGFVDYANLHDGVVGYVQALLHTSFDGGKTLVYQNVIDAILTGTQETVLEALHASPWCDPPYPLKELQADLEEVVSLTGTPDTQTATLQSKIDAINAQIATLQKEIATLETEKKTVASEEFVTIGSTQKGIKLNSLWDVAELVYGGGSQWPKLLPLNPGIHPGMIQDGQEIRIK